MQGKRTYLVSAGVILAAVAGYLTGELSMLDAINAALMGLGLGTLRAGVQRGV